MSKEISDNASGGAVAAAAPLPVKLGHAHLKVRDVSVAERFYREMLGARVTERVAGKFSFLSLGGAHHDLALQEVPEAASPFPGTTGLYHVAFEFLSSAAFGRAVQELSLKGIEFSLVDHGISWACYFFDPDGNGVEIFVDRRASAGGRDRWEGRTRPLDLKTVVAGLCDT